MSTHLRARSVRDGTPSFLTLCLICSMNLAIRTALLSPYSTFLSLPICWKARLYFDSILFVVFRLTSFKLMIPFKYPFNMFIFCFLLIAHLFFSALSLGFFLFRYSWLYLGLSRLLRVLGRIFIPSCLYDFPLLVFILTSPGSLSGPFHTFLFRFGLILWSESFSDSLLDSLLSSRFAIKSRTSSTSFSYVFTCSSILAINSSVCSSLFPGCSTSTSSFSLFSVFSVCSSISFSMLIISLFNCSSDFSASFGMGI